MRPEADSQGIDESGASRVEVESAGFGRAHAVLDQAGRGWEGVVGRDRGHDDGVDLPRQDMGDLERGTAGTRGQ